LLYPKMTQMPCIKIALFSFHGQLHKCNRFLPKKGKAVPLQARRGPEGSRKVRFPAFVTTAQDGGSQPYAPAAFTPRKYSWYSFLLEAESTPGP